MIVLNKFIGTWSNVVTKYIVLTEFSKEKFSRTLPEKKLIVKPNFIEFNREIPPEDDFRKENCFLYVGRVSKEKGVNILLKAWERFNKDGTEKLVIIGDGPELDEMKKIGGDGVVFLGKQPSNIVMNYMRRAKYLVVPSIWYEGFPMTIVEALSVGTPIITSKLGSLKEIVIDGVNGFHFEPSSVEELSEVLERANDYKDYTYLCKSAKKEFTDKYSPKVNYLKLMKIYKGMENGG